jgi:hypothetical protein
MIADRILLMKTIRAVGGFSANGFSPAFHLPAFPKTLCFISQNTDLETVFFPTCV